MIENGQMNKIEDLISKHWEWAKDKIGKDGIKYSDKYSKEEHERWDLKTLKQDYCMQLKQVVCCMWYKNK